MEPLNDPCNDRPVKTVKPPPHRPLSNALMYPDSSKPNAPDLNKIRSHLLEEGSISKTDLVKLITDVTAVFKSEPNIIKLQEPVIIIGDIHG
jgi:serine/threonine-protein phosphatase 2B catalytic subunit